MAGQIKDYTKKRELDQRIRAVTKRIRVINRIDIDAIDNQNKRLNLRVELEDLGRELDELQRQLMRFD